MTLGFLVLAGILVLIVLSALFSGLETALLALKPHQLRRMEENHAGLTKFVHVFRENPRRVLSVLLFGGSLVNVPLVILGLFFLWHNPFGTRIPQWLAAIVIFTVIVVLCDLIPKVLALSAPYRLSALGAMALRLSLPLLERVGDSLHAISTALVDLFTPSGLKPRQRLSDKEFGTLVEIGEEEGALHEAEAEMIQEIIKLGDKTAKDCMTPRIDSFMLPDNLTNEEAVARLKEQRNRRVPVYVDTPDQVLGIIEAKTFLLNPADHYTECLIAPSFVPETMRALDLLKLFLSHAQGLAVVVDEFGGTEGVITLSDIVEEILSDALPRGDEKLYIEPLEDGRLLVNGKARLDDLSDYPGFEIEADGIDTIGGFIFNRLGHLPATGTQFEVGNLSVTVRRTERKRIEQVVLERKAGTDGEGAV